jgi:hypothetical protein
VPCSRSLLSRPGKLAWLLHAGLALLLGVTGCAPAAPTSSSSEPALSDLQALDVPDSPSSFAVDLLGGQTGSESAHQCSEPGGPYTVDDDTGLGVNARAIAANLGGEALYQAPGAQARPAELAMTAAGDVSVRGWSDSASSDAGVCPTFTEFAATAELRIEGDAAETFSLRVRAVSEARAVARGVNPTGTRRLTLEQTPSGVWGWVEELDGDVWRSLAVLQAAEP